MLPSSAVPEKTTKVGESLPRLRPEGRCRPEAGVLPSRRAFCPELAGPAEKSSTPALARIPFPSSLDSGLLRLLDGSGDPWDTACLG